MDTVMKVLFLVLCSGILLFPLAANHLRSFTHSEGKYNWTDARNNCSSEEGSLLSLNDKEDDDMIFKFIESLNIDFAQPWLGLTKNLTYVPTWSNGEKVIFNESTTNWETGEQLCEAFENGTWKGFNCSEKKAFMCQNGNNYSLVQIKKNWCQAMQHCRTHFKDLASINGSQQNYKLKNESQGKSFWIGLRHDEFEWTDKSCSTYRNVEKGKVEQCFFISTSDPFWKRIECENTKSIICFKGEVKIRLITEPKTWEEALDYCTANHSRFLWIEDEEDQNAVEQWLKFTYTGTGSTNPLWIGLKQSSVFGFWIWSDRIVNYNKWENGQQPEMPLSNQCGVIDAKNYTWSDEKCWRQLPFLCEEDIIYMNT